MAWWRSPAMPATALVIGNPEMQDTAWALHIKSLAGALPWAVSNTDSGVTDGRRMGMPFESGAVSIVCLHPMRSG